MLAARRFLPRWSRLTPRWLPFADAASADLPLPRLLRLSLFQVSVGMALTLLVGTLNRVLIVELNVSAALVAIMVALPVLYAPLRALVGFRSDTHRSALGWRRVPFIWTGTMLQFGGLAIMPFTLLVLAGGGNAAAWPAWVGPAGAALAFLLVGAGLHTTQTAGLALATDLAAPAAQPRVVGLMYVMLLLGSILSAVLFGAFLREFTPGRLVQVVQAAAVATLVLNTLALWKQEARRPQRGAAPASRPAGGFRAAWAAHVERPGAQRLLLATGLGTVGFAMQDVLLEPYGAQVLGLGVGATTFLTGLLAAGGLAGFALASARPGGGRRAVHTAMLGAAAGALAFAAVALATGPEALPMFIAGVFAIGAGGGLFAHATLSLAMERAAPEQAGLALGAWGAVQATAAGFAVGAGGVLRDLLDTFAAAGEFGPAFTGIGTGYRFVYVTEAVLLVATLGVLVRVAGRRAAAEPPGGGAGEAPSSPRR